MKILDNSKKAKKVFLITIGFFSVIIISALGIFVYVYSGKQNEIKDLQNENSTLEKSLENNKISSDEEFQAAIDEYEQQIDDLEEEIKKLKNENEALDDSNDSLTTEKKLLETENSDLEQEVSLYEQKQATIRNYNDFHNYVYYLIATKGFTGYTEDEYNTARTKAVATGNNDLVTIVDQIWYEHDGNPTEKFATMMDEVIEGIYENL